MHTLRLNGDSWDVVFEGPPNGTTIIKSGMRFDTACELVSYLNGGNSEQLAESLDYINTTLRLISLSS